MNILVLHGIEDAGMVPKAVSDLELSLGRFEDKSTCLYHSYKNPFPNYLKDFRYDGIIIWSTFLDARHLRSTYDRVRSEYSFISTSDATVIALPQDDYYCNELLDQWMIDWNVDFVYSVLFDQANLLLPKCFEKGILKRGYTGYIFPEMINLEKKIILFEERIIDVSYRASSVPSNLNRLGQFKAGIARDFNEKFAEYNLKIDVSTRKEDFIFGKDWLKFIENSRFVLGVNSGSSIRIPNLEISERIEEYTKSNPNAKYDLLVDKFLADQHLDTYYTAISPRNIEASLLESCQISTDLGRYSDIMIPGIHFIAISPTCDNHMDVFEQMKDRSLVLRMIHNCKEAMLSKKRLRVGTLYSELADLIKSNDNYPQSSEIVFKNIVIRHRLHIEILIAKKKWANWKTHSKTSRVIKKIIKYKNN